MRRGLPGWLVIARRELLERVRTRWFAIVTLLGPIAMIGIIVVPAVLAARSGETARVVVVDQGAPASQMGAALVAAMNDPKVGWHAELAPADTPPAQLLQRIAKEDIDGFLTLPAGLAESSGDKLAVVYEGDNATNQKVVLTMSNLVDQAVTATRLARFGVTDPAQVKEILSTPDFETRHTNGETPGTSGTAMFLVGYAAMFILYMSIILYGVNVMRSVVQEKTNRVVEVMVASTKPRTLMLGKILGVGAAGLIQVGVWVVMALVTLHYNAQILGVFGVKTGGWTLPSLGPDAVAVVLGYFLLGYFFYASVYAAIGAMVSSEQEAQQAQTPVILLLVVPMLSMQVITNAPRGGNAQLLTMLPFSSPILMPMRYLLGGAGVGEVLVSMAILAASTWVVAWLAARIYRVGILMYGKRPSLRELARWIRHA